MLHTDDNINLDSDLDLSSLTSTMDLSFNVTLPYSQKSNNASDVSSDGKELKWNLSSTSEQNIEFEFELYNMTTIYMAAGIAVLLIIIVVVAILSKKKKRNPSDVLPQAPVNTPPVSPSVNGPQSVAPTESLPETLVVDTPPASPNVSEPQSVAPTGVLTPVDTPPVSPNVSEPQSVVQNNNKI